MSSPPHTVVDEIEPGPGAAHAPRRWAAEQLRATLVDLLPGSAVRVLVRDLAAAQRLSPESFMITNVEDPSADARTDALTIAVDAADDRAVVYALLELRDLVLTSDDPMAALRSLPGRLEQPHVEVRSVSRLFTSQGLDSGWFHDHAFWDEYLTELATHRFNRFTMAFGLGYDYLIDKRVVDNYLYFLYPFVLDVPGHDVTVAGFSAAERDRNLATLRHIGEATARRGLQFGLGLWNHAYRLEPTTPTERWQISGLGPDNHAAYCADALEALLNAVPDVSALTFRVHFEGGVPEPTHDFWRTVTAGIARVDRTIALDAHAKGINADLLDALRSAGSPLTLSTKYWGEHMGLPYHQAGIREKEFSGHRRRQEQVGESGGRNGADVTARRSFTRYGYADYARTDADYRLLHRVWPGTQRVLLQGDPELAAGIGRQADFAGSVGVEWFDALTFLGKKSSAEHPLTGADPVPRRLAVDDRQGGADPWSWHKYRLQLRLHGRSAYDPDAPADGWRRGYRSAFGAAAADAEAALSHATRILPLITTAHAPSVAGNIYWPELDTPIPLVERAPVGENPYAVNGWHLNADFDMEPPYTFGHTSPLDPQLFANADDVVDSELAGDPTARYSPSEVADWLEGLATTALAHRSAASSVEAASPELAQLLVDVGVAAHLGLFFAHKCRAAVAWRWHTRTGSGAELDACLLHYRSARSAWADAAAAAAPYVDDLPFGQLPYQRGHWRDRLPGIDDDLAAVTAHAAHCACEPEEAQLAPVRRLGRLTTTVRHTVPVRFQPGQELPVSVALDDGSGVDVFLWCRTVDQSVQWRRLLLVADGADRSGEIPADLTAGDYPVQYYFELRHRDRDGVRTALSPGLDPVRLSGQPYYVVHPDPATRWGRHPA